MWFPLTTGCMNLFVCFFFFSFYIPPSIMSHVLHPLDYKPLFLSVVSLYRKCFSHLYQHQLLCIQCLPWLTVNQSAAIFIHGQKRFRLILTITTKIFISVSLIVTVKQDFGGIHVIINLTCFFLLYAYFHVKANDVKIFQFLLV